MINRALQNCQFRRPTSDVLFAIKFGGGEPPLAQRRTS
jgi:hypothetical protein